MLPTAYEVCEELVRTPLFVLSHGNRRSDHQPVLLKYPGATPFGATDELLLEREYALLHSLNCAGVPKPIEFVRRRGQCCIVLEDQGQRPLTSQTPNLLALSLTQFFDLAISLCTIVSELHHHEVIHRQIQPRHVFQHPETGEVTLFGFEFATTGDRESFGAPAIPLLADLLSYCSPELTGRMNRNADYRTDFYSLGMTFYELLTGRLPVSSSDPLEIVNWQLACTPVPPHEIDKRLPIILSELVMKLLSKNAPQRYQSALGLRVDLEHCRRDWIVGQQIASFPLAQQDIANRFLLPQKLYGREREAEKMLSMFDRASTGEGLLILVAGYSGVGKTSFVQELYRPIVRRRGYFITGKFDQVVRAIPFGAIFRAFGELVDQLLAESEESQREWRRRILTALGSNAGVVAEAVPRVRYLIGEHEAPPPLDPTERENRFRLVFQTLLGVVATKEHPLVIFLDDLQWADPATLHLLDSLLTHSESRHLLIIGAYRDNEVDSAHPLTRMFLLPEQNDKTSRIKRLKLGPLDLGALEQFIHDTLHRDRTEIAPLARLVKEKTDGNPFFVTQFLKSLHQERLVQFDEAKNRWTFRIEAIANAAITDNVVDLMTARIHQLSVPAQEVITLAACFGDYFDLATLAGIQQKPIETTAANLQEAIDQGLILPLNRAGLQNRETPVFTLLHDRVQQAAYGSVSSDRREQLHLRIGRLLLTRGEGNVPEEELFSIVSHLNLGRGLFADSREQFQLSRLNFDAGLKAKVSTAYQAARDYFRIAMELSPPEGWEKDYEFMLALHLDAAECEYLCGDIERAEQDITELLACARTRVDKARIYRMKIVRYEYLSRYSEAIRVGQEALALFGLMFPDSPEDRSSALDAELAAIAELIGARSIESLIELPVMSNREACAAMQLLASLHTPCYLSADKILTLLNTALMVRLSLTHGNINESALAYVLYGMMLGPIKGDYASAYEFGLLALHLNERLPDAGFRAKVLMNFSWAISIWRKPFADSFPYIRETVQLVNQTGMFSEAGYALFNAVYLTILSRHDLAAVKPACDENVAFLKRVKMEAFEDAPRVILQWARALQGYTERATSLTGDGFDETAYCRTHKNQGLFEMLYLVPKFMLFYSFEDYQAATEILGELDRVLRDYTGTIWDAITVFYQALLLTGQAGLRSGALDQSPDVWAKLDTLSARLRNWADNAPENFRAQSLIVSAEIARVRGSDAEALDLFGSALDVAAGQECPRELALANEFLARFWNQRGHPIVASLFLRAAIDRYAEWGAIAKARQLEEKFPHLLKFTFLGESKDITVAGSRGEAAIPLDFATLTKAAQAIAGEIEFDTLLKTLIQISIENAGAQRGIFLQESDGELRMMAEGTTDSASLLDAARPDYATQLPQSITQYVRKTGESLVLEDAVTDVRFGNDPYVAATGTQSVLCVPVVHQGKSAGILYLENNLAAKAFTAERVRVLHVLCAQAAISLANASLYAEMKREVARRSQAESELHRTLAELHDLKNRLEAENIYLQEEIRREHNFEEMIGNSPALVEVLRKVEVVAPLDSTVLILGETGSGKELVARAIHDRSSRKGRPLVKVNCGAISAGLVESELFGHVKGAFTGALTNRDGRFKLADGGTLFLDEIGELPLDTQVKILRVLQEQEFEPIGSSRTIRVDIRIIAATNRDLEVAIREMRFRQDLFYRLNVFPLTVPALRERVGDVRLLVMFFLAKFNKKFGKKVDRIPAETMQRLVNYHWPGNIRELQNVIERAVILSNGPVLVLDAEFHFAARPEAAGPNALAHPDPSLSSASSSLDDITKRHILSVLAQTDGIIEGPKGAAKILGVHPNTLRSRMQKLGIVRQPS
jgi:predicted ATPase/transcriptional regulator with GAF, ATPase, and Fis domain